MPRDFEYFYEWDGVAEQWITTEESFDQDFPSKPQDPGTSLAAFIITDIFGLTLGDESLDKGGYLPGYDVVNRDAYQMIQLSLATELKNNTLVECYADGYGVVHFYDVAVNYSTIRDSVLYSVTTDTLSKKCDMVMVIGYDPPPKRYVGQEFNLLTFGNDMTDEYYYKYLPEFDEDKGNFPIYNVLGSENLLGPESCSWFKKAYIEYADPGLDHEGWLIEQEVYNPKQYESVASYLYKVEVGFYKQGSTNVTFANSTPKYIMLQTPDGNPNMGKLLRREYRSANLYVSDYCLQDQDISADVGVRLPRSNERKFLGVKEVYIYGYYLKRITPDLYVSGFDRIEGPSDFIVDVDTTLSQPFKLTSGEDYLIAADASDSDYYRIVFSSNVSPPFDTKFGSDYDGNPSTPTATFRISSASLYMKAENGDLSSLGFANIATDPSDPTAKASGLLRDGKTEANNYSLDTQLIFPMNEGQSGYVVKRIIVVYEWDNPCIVIEDQSNIVTEDNLRNELKFSFYPVINKDVPAPVAVADESGVKLLDPTDMLPDYDATTVQDLQSSEYARAFASMEPGDIKITLPFLDGDECQSAASYIYELQNEVIESTTYMCDPTAEPVLGELIDGKTINSINYSYQDSSQYLISVQAGPVWRGLSGWDTSIYKNQTEQLTREGIVTNVYSDNMKCQVKVGDLGIMECINNTKDVLEKGDRVSVTIYNNPVSI